MDDDQKNLEFFISERLPFAVVVLIGGITKETLDILLSCKQEIMSKDSHYVIISFRDVKEFTIDAIKLFVEMQAELRKTKKVLRLVSIHPKTKEFLIRNGVVRESELDNNLSSALQGLQTLM